MHAFLQAAQRMRSTSEDWYFCRGYFLQTSNSFQPYTDLELTGRVQGMHAYSWVQRMHAYTWAQQHPAG